MTIFSETNITHPAPHRTHTVLNQSAPRTDVNEFTLDTVLSEGVRRHHADWATGELTDIGALVGSATFQHDAELANTIIPELKTFDRWGNRIDEVEYHPAYHRIISAAVAHGRTRRRGPTRSPARTSLAQRHS